MADGVHPTVNQVQPAARESTADRVAIEPDTNQLRSGDNPMLSPREVRDHPVEGCAFSSTAYMRLK
jgi:hypothetical protein